MLCAMLCAISFFSSLFSVSALEKSKNEYDKSINYIDEYLLDAGYPEDIITSLDEGIKLDFYNDKCSYQSSETTYGIFTEDYHIEYTLNKDGVISIDNESISQLNQLRNRPDVITKILYMNKVSNDISTSSSMVNISAIENSEPITGKATSNTSISSGDDYEQSIQNFQSEHMNMINSLQQQSNDIVLLTLTNWKAYLICSHISHSNNYLRKKLTYSWDWTYDPIVTDVDKVAMAWSKDFNSQPSTVKWTYTMQGKANDGRTNAYTYSDNSYDEYVPGCGVGKNIDIHDWFEWDDTPRYYIYKHSGTLSTEITKYFYGVNDEGSAVGRYYHHTLNFSGGTLGFSSAPAITMSAGFGSVYDPSPDTGCVFKFYK